MDRMHPLNAPPTGLYIHVPFCVRRCLYCDFYVIPLGDGPPSKRLREFRTLRHRGFLHALDRELARLPRPFQPETVYIGGGTPTELAPKDLQRLFDALHRHIDLSRVRETTCEANPGTLDPEMADLLLRNRVDRVSLGVQSFRDSTLETLGRIHNRDDAYRAVKDLRAAGLRHLALDLLFAVPDTSPADVDANLQALDDLNPEHVSWYALEFEPDTAFTRLRDRGYLREPDQEQAAEEYEHIRQGLQRRNYLQYELFSFCRPGHECLHNLNYWNGGGFHGCGPSAHRHVDGTRAANPPDIDHYLREGAPTPPEQLPPDAKARERLMTALRLTRGVDVDEFARATGFHPHDLMGPHRQRWIASGRLEEHRGLLRLRPEAYLVSDALFREFI